VKLAAWQWIYGGTTSPQEFADSNTYKHLLCAIESFVPTCFTGIPFENARRAYYADKSWPVELRRGYTSPLNALVRIPFEEGIGYLFKGGFPIWSSAFMFWTTFCTIYSFAKNKFFFLWTYQDFNYSYIKAGMMTVAFSFASVASYPLYFTRTMVDLWPKERGGHCTWNNSYRQCAKFMIENMDQLYFNFMAGYTQWLRRYGISYFIALWMADNLGMFSNVNDSWNSLETNSPISSESV
jgi:solute carrier family 25 oxoglutarate transporter 11